MKIKNDNIGRLIAINWNFLLVILLFTSQTLFSKDTPYESHPDSVLVLARKYYHNNEYDSASLYYNTALNLSEKKDYLNGIVDSQIGLANCSNAQEDYPYTIALTTKCLELIKQKVLTNSTWTSTLYYLKGLAEYNLRKNDESIISLSEGIKIYNNQINHDSIYTQLYKILGNNYLVTGNLNDAKSAYELALKNELKNQDTSLLAASLIMNIGIVYSRKTEFLKGEEYFKKSLRIKEQKSPEENKNFTNNYINLGRLQLEIGKNDDALISFNKAEKKLLDKYGTKSVNLIPIYLNKGGLYIIKSEYGKALTYHEKALELAISYYPEEDQILSRIYGNLGTINKYLGNYNKAIDWLGKAEQINNTVESRIVNFRTIAFCYQELGETEKAIQYYELAIDLAVKPGNKDLSQIKYCYSDYGKFNDLIGNSEKAEKYLLKAIKIFKLEFGDSSTIYSSNLTDLGFHYSMKGDFRQALKYFQESLIIYSENFEDTNIYSNPELAQITWDDNLKETLFNKANAFYSLYEKTKNKKDLIAGHETINLAIHVFENLRTSFTHEKSKLFATKDSKNLFDLAIRTALKLGEETNDPIYTREAFIFSEKSKSAVLLSTIRESRALSFGGIPENILAMESKLKSDISTYSNLIYNEDLKRDKNQENISFWRDQLIVQNRLYDSLITVFELNYPEYYQLKYNNSAIDISELQLNLSETEILIEYDLFDSVLIIFTITKKDIKYTKVIIGDSFINNVKSVIEITHEYPMVENASERLYLFANKSHALYKKMLEPLDTRLKDKREIIIIPDDILGFVSFEALVKQLPPGKIGGYNKLDYLINDYCLRYSYSASLMSKANKKPNKKTKILAIAPTYSNDIVLPPTEEGLGLSLAPLDYAKLEVENIQNYFPCEILEGKNATESRFKKLSPDFNILHFSMHTIINNEEPLASKLVFSLKGDTIDDGFLNTYEIYNLPLNADLAVLSSCETGGGKLSKGEGILSLARGFIYSGVSSIVMTLWEIDDVSSADIISGFYKRLKEGEKIDKALRNSKLNYLHTSDQLHAHPYFWSAYVQIGDNLPIAANSFSIKKILIASFIIVVVIVLLLIKRKRD